MGERSVITRTNEPRRSRSPRETGDFSAVARTEQQLVLDFARDILERERSARSFARTGEIQSLARTTERALR